MELRLKRRVCARVVRRPRVKARGCRRFRRCRAGLPGNLFGLTEQRRRAGLQN
jgi:hypothetical protein